MSKSLFSSSWYRVADLKPRLRPHTATHRHVFRGKIWYVLQDHQTGRFHRLSSIANLMLSLMDGRRTVGEIWEAAGRKSAEDPPTQDETIQLLAQLHSADLLQGELPPDFGEMAERAEQAGQRRVMQQLRNPIAFRLPLFDPDRFLDATQSLVRPLFSIAGFLGWLVLIASALVLATLHWSELTSDLADRVLAAENLALIMCVYPVIKSLHELGHAYATKIWGGEVHEIGVMLLVFIPILYVDASASAAFRQKRRRIIVGAAGIMVETALAAIAMFVWLHAAPGLGRTIAFNVMLVGGVSTLLFNGNPLLRFDGYYIFSDLIEIPNLASRSNAYFLYLIQKRLLKIDDVESPATAPGEAVWFLLYAISSFAYRMVVSIGIALFLANKFIVIGSAMAIWSLAAIFLLPLYKGLKFLAASPRLQGRRRRAFGVMAGLAIAASAALFLIPLPYATVADGVVVFPDQAELRAKTAGFVREVKAPPGTEVEARQPLVAMDDPALRAHVAVLTAQLDETLNRLEAVKDIDRVQAEMFSDQAHHLETKLDTFHNRQRDLTVSADHPGRFVMARAEDLPGRFAKRGELLGYVIGAHDPVIQLLVPQSDIDLIRNSKATVQVRLADDIDHPIAARIRRETPAAQQNVPSLALTTRGGGEITLDPSRGQQPAALFRFFLVEIELLEPTRVRYLGMRAYVRFSFEDQPIAWRVIRSARQFFLGQFRG
ncbi:PqqD family peptide modification chaperone [uncultured Rhodoblastus sp.]|uniref:PqqD family peptide modification chaperone n=1 Tax=uncultured Rhodoblastus sp. TaxID=543037 RepID=UPI0025CEB15D|nr:PqqD family peptide modification chaperone [uncultured Rhodoblastus sp.]